MTDLHEPVKCGTCTACCRASSGVVLQPPDVLNAYIMAPATAELAAKLQRTNPGALLPLEELPDAPADFLQICKQVGAPLRLLNSASTTMAIAFTWAMEGARHGLVVRRSERASCIPAFMTFGPDPMTERVRIIEHEAVLGCGSVYDCLNIGS